MQAARVDDFQISIPFLEVFAITRNSNPIVENTETVGDQPEPADSNLYLSIVYTTKMGFICLFINVADKLKPMSVIIFNTSSVKLVWESKSVRELLPAPVNSLWK